MGGGGGVSEVLEKAVGGWGQYECEKKGGVYVLFKKKRGGGGGGGVLLQELGKRTRNVLKSYIFYKFHLKLLMLV